MTACKPYGIVFNSDGGDVFSPESATPEGFAGVRLKHLEGTQVGAISYCTGYAFNACLHNTRVGEVFDKTTEGVAVNHVRTMIESGRDCLQLVIDWAQQQGVTAFWSLRMNDCHDGRLPEHRSHFKKDHPEWLVGSEDQTEGFVGDYRWWSAVNYAVPEVRERALALIEEICLNYDVDGIELDLNRHPIYFPEQRLGQAATPGHVAMVTDLVRSVRSMTREAGGNRGRPFVLSARVPDALDMALHVGLDVATWLREGLLDVLIPGDYYPFTDLSECIALAHQHDVVVYPCISATRIHGRAIYAVDPTPGEMLSWRGEALNIWNAGADGVCTFNGGPIHAPLWKEIGDGEALQELDRVYASTGGPWQHIDRWHGEGTRRKYGLYPVDLQTGQPATGFLQVSEEVGNAQLHLQVRFGRVSAEVRPDVALNGQALEEPTAVEPEEVERYAKETWWQTPVPPEVLKRGRNEIVVRLPEGVSVTEEPALFMGHRLHLTPL